MPKCPFPPSLRTHGATGEVERDDYQEEQGKKFLEHAVCGAQVVRGNYPVAALFERRKDMQYKNRRSETAATVSRARNSTRGDIRGAARHGVIPGSPNPLNRCFARASFAARRFHFRRFAKLPKDRRTEPVQF